MFKLISYKLKAYNLETENQVLEDPDATLI